MLYEKKYWSIDPDYDGVTFRSTWQDYREAICRRNGHRRKELRHELLSRRYDRRVGASS